MDINGIKYLGIDRVLKRGTGEVLEDLDNALLVRDTVSGAFFLACEDEKVGITLLDCYTGPDLRLLMVSDYALGQAAFERYGFSEKLECWQFAYYGEKPVIDTGLSVREADEQDLPMLTRHYHMLSPEELKEVLRRKSILLGYDQGHLVGFIGEHLEGSMGILYVLPEYRRRGYGIALQTCLMARTMDEGFIPFGQVEKDNLKSLRLQEKLGMTRSDELIVWMWKNPDSDPGKITLCRPSSRYARQVMDFRDELKQNSDGFDGCAGLEDCASFEEWTRFEERLRAKYKEGYVPSDVFLAVREADDRLVGIIDYRHPLSDFLLKFGGNIGYSVRPSERRKGYASEMLRLMLDICRSYGEKRVLLTCDSDNTASRKTILKNGGVLENEIENTVGLSKCGRIQRYWILTGSDI